MRNDDRHLSGEVRRALQKYAREVQALPGILETEALNAFVFQVVESMRRIRFVEQISDRTISPLRSDPDCELFDPIRAAILNKRAGDYEEAFWLVFLFTHFGKNRLSGYRLIRDIYGKLGQGGTWSWVATKADTVGFRHWLDQNMNDLKSGDVHRAFGNHRKYQSLDAWKVNGTGDAVQSYIDWVSVGGSHETLFGSINNAHNNPEDTFGAVYRSMSSVRSFGRTAKFDYLSMIGKIGLANIRPDSVHFGAATGPVTGAKLLFYGSHNADQSTRHLENLANALAASLGFDKQVMEDSLCNWQKNPRETISFRG